MVLCSGNTGKADLYHLFLEGELRVELVAHDDNVQTGLWDVRCVVVSSDVSSFFHRRGESDACAFSDRKSFW